jgi:hypothetical protein
MPLHRNPWIEELLTWHGHSTGGVRVPFAQQGGNPLPQTIVTRLVERLRRLARHIATGQESPRWVFLVGGPGNGKSEAVQDFLLTLDSELGCQGKLVDLLRQRFAPNPLVQWRVVLDAQSAPVLPQTFHKQVGRLVVVQDASASEEPGQDAAAILVDSILDLLTSPHQETVFICCVNRGLLARSLKRAARRVQEDSEYQEVIDLLRQLIRTTSLGKEALVPDRDRPPCWPLDKTGSLQGRIACWPLDMESLLLSPEHGGIDPSPVEQIFVNASLQDKWETPGTCLDCDAAHLCPFRQNAIWLREPATRVGLIHILRRGELATGQRWNFRDTFSLAAELLVGEWGDFPDHSHPCEWVHHQAKLCDDHISGTTVQAADTIRSSFSLLMRLYPYAMFPGLLTRGLPRETHKVAQQRHFTRTIAIETCVSSLTSTAQTHIRTFLQEKLLPKMDPALFSPHDPSHIIGAIEDSYNQSVQMGNESWMSQVFPSTIERLFFDFCRDAEDEWGHLSRESAQVSNASKFLRVLCSSLAKRSVGLRCGFHAGEPYLRDYERVLRDEDALAELTGALRSLLGERGFHFNTLESFGQPQSEREWLVALEGSAVSIQPIIAAPVATPHLPAHDVPFIPIARHAIPLTFDLYLALCLRQDGCTSGSLPASVRAALDRIRHLQAGELCHQDSAFVSGLADYRVQKRGIITLSREKGTPKFRRS